MEARDYITIFGAILLFAASIGASIIAARVQLRRIPSQNRHEDIEVAKEAMDMAADSVMKIKELQARVAQLENEMSNSKYKVTFITRLGEMPEIKSATIERL